MKVYRFKCKDCGSKRYEKIDDKTYRCLYCGNIEIFMDEKIKEEIKEEKTAETIDESARKTEKLKVVKKFTDNESLMLAIVKLIVCIFAGEFGVHKFMERKIFMGLLYLFTFGLFGIGWIIDIVRYGIDVAIEATKFAKEQVNVDD